MLTRGRSVFTPVFSSRQAPALTRYVDLKRALGRRFDLPSRTRQSLDRFLHEQSATYPELNAAGRNHNASFLAPVHSLSSTAPALHSLRSRSAEIIARLPACSAAQHRLCGRK